MSSASTPLAVPVLERSPRRVRRAPAFTLVELLVVIGIIAVLISILLPGLQKARQHAVSLQCLSNLRGIGQVLYLYAHQNRGMFPPMALQSPETLPKGGKITGPDASRLLPHEKNYPDVRSAIARIVNPNRDTDDVPYAPGGLKIFYCPANFFWDGDLPGPTAKPGFPRSHWPDDYIYPRGRIRYWYYGNPNPHYPKYHYPGPFGVQAGAGGVVLPGSPPAANPGGTLDWRIWDTNHNGDNRDEYVVKLGDKNMTQICLVTDHSRQASFGGSTYGFQFVHGSRQYPLDNGWKNNLYADGHAESKRPRRSSFSADGKFYTNTQPSPEEVQPRWGNARQYQMW